MTVLVTRGERAQQLAHHPPPARGHLGRGARVDADGRGRRLLNGQEPYILDALSGWLRR